MADYRTCDWGTNAWREDGRCLDTLDSAGPALARPVRRIRELASLNILGIVISITYRGLIASLVVTSVQAQQLENYLPSNLSGFDVMPGVSVTSRLRPEYSPLGIRLGNTLISPQASQSIGFDDNVLGTADKRDSPVLNTRGAVQAATTLPNSHLELELDINHYGYTNLSSQSYTNWSAGGGWSHEIGRDTVAIGVNHFHLNQLPVGIDSIGIAKPLPFNTDVARLSYKATRGQWTFVPLVDFAATRFNDTDPNVIPGQLTTSRDRNVETGSFAAFYEFAPQRSAMVVVRGSTAQYTAGDLRPDYDDAEALAGLDYNVTGPIRFRALVGYEVRSYRNSTFKNYSSPVTEVTLIWTPTGLTTVSGSVNRQVADSNEVTNTGYTFTQARLAVDHEYLRNVLLQGRVLIAHANYLQTNDAQTIYGAGAGVTYLLSRNLRVSATYDILAVREGSGTNTKYNRNVFLVQVKFEL